MTKYFVHYFEERCICYIPIKKSVIFFRAESRAIPRIVTNVLWIYIYFFFRSTKLPRSNDDDSTPSKFTYGLAAGMRNERLRTSVDKNKHAQLLVTRASALFLLPALSPFVSRYTRRHAPSRDDDRRSAQKTRKELHTLAFYELK